MSLTGFYVHVFDRLGRCFFSHLNGILPRLFIDLYSWTIIWLSFLGWLAAPQTHFLPVSVVALFRGTPILAGGIGVARFVVGFVLLFVLCFRAIMSL